MDTPPRLKSLANCTARRFIVSAMATLETQDMMVDTRQPRWTLSYFCAPTFWPVKVATPELKPKMGTRA